jgi:hypothetical protein
MWKKSVIFCPEAQIQHNFHGSSEENLERGLLKWYNPTLIVDTHDLLTMNEGCKQLNFSASLDCVAQWQCMYGCDVISMLPELRGKDAVSFLLSCLQFWLVHLGYCKTRM